jgi:hypothetical protein
MLLVLAHPRLGFAVMQLRNGNHYLYRFGSLTAPCWSNSAQLPISQLTYLEEDPTQFYGNWSAHQEGTHLIVNCNSIKELAQIHPELFI